MVFSEYKTEVIGISAEVAIADLFDIKVNDRYRARSSAEVIRRTIPIAEKAFRNFKIPNPAAHIAEDQNPVDFTLANGGTLSVKSNQKSLGKVAPQRIGQPTSHTFWKHFLHLADGPIPTSYELRKEMFKRVAIGNIEELMTAYWENLFEADYLVYFYSFVGPSGTLLEQPTSMVLQRTLSPKWSASKFTFTQSEKSWNESNTVKYCGRSIGEFQIHNGRDCFKFRFNMSSVVELIASGELSTGNLN